MATDKDFIIKNGLQVQGGDLDVTGAIDVTGKIGVGADTASFWSQANSLVLDDGGNTGLTIKSNSTGNGRVVFTDTTSTTAGLNDGGQIHYGHTNDEMKIRTAGTDAITIDSSQNATFAGNITVGDSHTIGDDVNDNLEIASSTGENILINSANQVYLQTGGSNKLETTSAGVEVTGRVNTDTAFIGTGNTNNISHGALVINHGTLPQILFDGGGDTNLDIAVPNSEILQIGHWNTTTSSATLRLSMESGGTFDFEGNPIQGVGGLTVNGDISLPDAASTIDFGGTGNGGPHGLNFADDDGSTIFRVLYRTSPNTLTFEDAGESAKHTFELSGNYTNTGNIYVGALLVMPGGSGNPISFIGTGTDTNARNFAYEASGDHYVTNRHTDGDLVLMSNNGTGGGETARITLQSGSGTQDIDISNANLDLNSNNIKNVGTLTTSSDINGGGKVKGTNMEIEGAAGSSGFLYIFDSDNGTSNTDGFLIQKSGNNAFVYNRESSGTLSLGAGDTSNYLVIDSNGNIDLGTTQILDQSGNLTNIGTIDSGAITSTGAITAQGSSGGFFYAEDTTTSTAADDLVGGFLFKSNDGSGTPPHYAGMTARQNNIYGSMQLEFFADRADYESDTPGMVFKPDGADSSTNTLSFESSTSITGVTSISSGAITSSGTSTFGISNIKDGSNPLIYFRDASDTIEGGIGFGSVTDGLFRIAVGNLGLITDTVMTINSSGNAVFDGTITVNGNNILMDNIQARVKYAVWDNNTYGIGMQSGYTFGGLANDFAMTFQMNDSNGRGFWWGDSVHTNAEGAMALTTNGYLTVARGIRIGYGETDTTTPSSALDVSGTISSGVIDAVVSNDVSGLIVSTLGDGGGASNTGLAIVPYASGGILRTVGTNRNMLLQIGTSTALTLDSSLNATFAKSIISNENSGITINTADATYAKIKQDYSSADILELTSFGSMQFAIDENNNSTNKYFIWKDGGEGTGGTELMSLSDGGVLSMGSSGSIAIDGTTIIDSNDNIVNFNNIISGASTDHKDYVVGGTATPYLWLDARDYAHPKGHYADSAFIIGSKSGSDHEVSPYVDNVNLFVDGTLVHSNMQAGTTYTISASDLSAFSRVTADGPIAIYCASSVNVATMNERLASRVLGAFANRSFPIDIFVYAPYASCTLNFFRSSSSTVDTSGTPDYTTTLTKGQGFQFQEDVHIGSTPSGNQYYVITADADIIAEWCPASNADSMLMPPASMEFIMKGATASFTWTDGTTSGSLTTITGSGTNYFRENSGKMGGWAVAIADGAGSEAEYALGLEWLSDHYVYPNASFSNFRAVFYQDTEFKVLDSSNNVLYTQSITADKSGPVIYEQGAASGAGADLSTAGPFRFVGTKPFHIVVQEGSGDDECVLLGALNDELARHQRFDGGSINNNIRLDDSIQLMVGTGNDGRFYHDGNDTFLTNNNDSTTLRIRQGGNDQDVLIESDNGSGGITTYFRADGSTGSADLFHYGSEKLTTLSGGVNVIGDLYIDGFQSASYNSNVLFYGDHGDDLEVDIQGFAGGSRIYMTDGSIYMYGNSNGTAEFLFTSSGALHADGNITAYSTTTGSDIKLKNNITTIDKSLDTILNLRGVDFTWKRNNKKAKGFIAQEVEKVLPELVDEAPTLGSDDETHKTVDYQGIIPILVEAIKEQQKQIDDLKKVAHPKCGIESFDGYNELIKRIEELEK